MRLSSAIVGILLGLAMMLGGCGKDGTMANKPPSHAQTTSVPSLHATTPRNACRQLRPFLGSMSKLRDDLARGLSYDDYLREVQRTRLVYDRIDVDRLAAGCLLASGGPAERALNLYIEATNDWGDCLATVSCNTRSIEPKLQHKWALAAHQLRSAQQGMRRP